ncbi:mitogen-activated protein kinase kinase kinase 5 [Citrus sinensis]|uniref:Mitogen-activated protein kinase kinase kinase 5 n=1 Tax=Citrus sinensis TaxID=2711 RepID=A0ACB8J386_CITSI|nr:mitogen-activated protein kinase kinase kinase 5 [Citrus sinensis]
MRWLHNIYFSSAPSSSSSSPVSAYSSRAKRDFFYLKNSRKIHFKNLNSNNNNNSSNSNKKNSRGPRLTRQKKLRHLSDQEVVGVTRLANPDVSESVSSRDNNSNDHSSSALRTSTSSPVPLPLPLPVPLRVDDERDRDGLSDRDRVDCAAPDRVSNSSSNSPIASVFSRRVGRKMPEFFDTKSSRSVNLALNYVERSRDNFRLNIPAKSAPTSPFTSPVRSPQRSVGGMFQYKVPNGNQGWSAPEMPTLDIPGLPPPAFFDYTVFSAESSPFHSPRSRSPCRNAISPSGPSSPIHSKLSRESTVRIEVHPLPLPPGAAVLSPSATIPQVPAKPEPLPMNSQWQKGKLIGRGTFGSVYVASNRETGALCAMKEVDIFPDDPKSAESIKQLEQEIKVLSHLKHPNIVQYYGSEIVEDKFYIYLEYVHPGSINKYVREHCGAITESVVRNFTRHILSGLAYLHSKKTIHRDIKGANLLVDASGVVKLADFGMAKHLTGQKADLSMKGSPYWMAPEKGKSSDSALAVDIWSLGCTIIEMYTGKPPWSEFEGAAAMFKVMRDTPAIPDSLSPEGKDFLRCCFQRNPADRPPASLLLEHRFLKNSQQPDVPSCSLSFSGMQLTEKPHSPREKADAKYDQVAALSSSRSSRKATLESENGRRSHLETSDLTVASTCSPRSTLEALPCLSPLHSGPSTRHSSASAIVLGLIGRVSKKNRVGR